MLQVYWLPLCTTFSSCSSLITKSQFSSGINSFPAWFTKKRAKAHPRATSGESKPLGLAHSYFLWLIKVWDNNSVLTKETWDCLLWEKILERGSSLLKKEASCCCCLDYRANTQGTEPRALRKTKLENVPRLDLPSSEFPVEWDVRSIYHEV